MKILYCPLQTRARSHPFQIAIETETHHYTFLELETLVSRACNFLDANIKSKGGSVFVLLATLELNTLLFFLASLRLSLIACLVDPKQSKETLKGILHELKTSFLIDPCNISLDPQSLHIERRFYPKNPITFLLTSGTVGKPKYVGLSLHNFYYSYKGIYKPIRLSSSSRYLLNLPLNHVSGLCVVFRALFSGSVLVLKKPQTTFSSFVLSENISHLSLVSLQLRRWLDEHHCAKYPNLKCVLIGGGPTSATLITKALEKNIPLFQSYGMTESCSTITCKKLKLGSKATCGKPLLYRRVTILKKNQIRCSGKTLFLGYLDTESMQLIPQKAFLTKDLGVFNHIKELVYLGRKDNMLICKGENIFPEEIELKLMSHPEIKRACIVAIETLEKEIELAAFLDTISQTIPHDIVQFSNIELPSLKRPQYYFIWPSSIQEETSKITKIQRKLLQEIALSKIIESS